MSHLLAALRWWFWRRRLRQLQRARDQVLEVETAASRQREARAAWFEEWHRREREMRASLGDPTWRARTLMSLSMPPAPPDPDGAEDSR